MTIKELVDEAQRLEPNVIIEAWDRVDYAASKATKRVVTAQVTGKGREGSAEDIVIEMADSATVTGIRLSDQVKRVVPGQTTLYWQAEPLIRAFDSLSARADAPARG